MMNLTKILFYLGVLAIKLCLFCFSSCIPIHKTVKVDDHDRPIYKNSEVPVYEDVEIVDYTRLKTPIFVDRNKRELRKPISLAVLDFRSQAGSTFTPLEAFTTDFHNQLIKQPGVWDKFGVFSPGTLKKLFNESVLYPENKSLMDKLAKNDFPFAVSAKVINSRTPEFEMFIYRTTDNTVVFNHLFKTTSSGNAMHDAFRLLLKEEVPSYRKEQRLVRYDKKQEVTGYQKKDKRVKDDDATLIVNTLLWIAILALVVAVAN